MSNKQENLELSAKLDPASSFDVKTTRSVSDSLRRPRTEMAPWAVEPMPNLLHRKGQCSRVSA